MCNLVEFQQPEIASKFINILKEIVRQYAKTGAAEGKSKDEITSEAFRKEFSQ